VDRVEWTPLHIPYPLFAETFFILCRDRDFTKSIRFGHFINYFIEECCIAIDNKQSNQYLHNERSAANAAKIKKELPNFAIYC